MDKSESALVRVSFMLSTALIHALVKNEVFTKSEAVAIIAIARKSVRADPFFYNDPTASQFAEQFFQIVELGITSMSLQKSS